MSTILNNIQKELILNTTEDVIKLINEESEAATVIQAACDYFNKSDKKVYQIKISITRDEDDFLDDFQSEIIKNYRP